MRIVAITRVLDEADIIEAFVRHTAAYVQHHIFVDNGSIDGTVEILRRYSKTGSRSPCGRTAASRSKRPPI